MKRSDNTHVRIIVEDIFRIIGAIRFCIVSAAILSFIGVICSPAHAVEGLFDILIPTPPHSESKLATLFADAKNHVVMEYDLGRIENDKVYFTDGHPLFGLSDSQSYALANTPFSIGAFIKSHNLTPLENVYAATAQYNHFSLQEHDIDAPMCRWPFDALLDIKRNENLSLRIMFFRRRLVAKKARYQVWCETGPGEVELTTRYENLPPIIFVNRDGRPLIALSEPPIVLRFNDKETKVFTHVVPGLLVVPARLAEHFYEMVAEHGFAPQDAVDRLESELDVVDAKAD